MVGGGGILPSWGLSVAVWEAHLVVWRPNGAPVEPSGDCRISLWGPYGMKGAWGGAGVAIGVAFGALLQNVRLVLPNPLSLCLSTTVR